MVEDVDEVLTEFPGDVVILDRRGRNDDDGVEIRYSFLINDVNQQKQILEILCRYEKAHPTGWERTVESMMIEWDAHNDSHALFTLTPFNEITDRAAHVYFNNEEEGWTYWDHTFGRFLKGR